MPISNTSPSEPIINQQGDSVEKYANFLATQLENSSNPACHAIASSFRSFGSSGTPDYATWPDSGEMLNFTEKIATDYQLAGDEVTKDWSRGFLIMKNCSEYIRLW